MSIFDVDAFMNGSIASPLSTERKLIPPGEYNAVVSNVEAKSGQVASGDNAGKAWARLDVTWEFQDQALRDTLNRAKVVLTQGVMLDLTDEGTLDTREGRNVNFGRLLKALDCNDAGSNVRMLVGRYGRVTVSHGSYQGNAREEIRGVTKA